MNSQRSREWWRRRAKGIWWCRQNFKRKRRRGRYSGRARRPGSQLGNLWSLLGWGAIHPHEKGMGGGGSKHRRLSREHAFRWRIRPESRENISLNRSRWKLITLERRPGTGLRGFRRRWHRWSAKILETRTRRPQLSHPCHNPRPLSPEKLVRFVVDDPQLCRNLRLLRSKRFAGFSPAQVSNAFRPYTHNPSSPYPSATLSEPWNPVTVPSRVPKFSRPLAK